MKKTYILYHKNCTDGFGAAYSAWKKFGNSATYIAINYGEPLPDLLPNSLVYVLDFCLKTDDILKIKSHSSLIIHDHHQASKGHIEKADDYIFDLTRSGAKISWSHFFPLTPNELIEYISDKDLAQFSLPNCDEVICALESYPMDFETWDKLSVADLAKEGIGLLRFKQNEIKLALEKSYIKKMGKYEVPVVNCSSFMGEIAEALLDKYPNSPFTASFVIYQQDGKTFKKWSLRSNKVDLSVIAKEFGGGGHPFAAAFIEEIGD